MRNDGIFAYAKENYTKYFNVINKKNYIFRATLLNPNNNIVEIEKSAIKELYFEDQIYNPFLSGYIVINNPEDVLERYKSDPTIAELTGQQQYKGYTVRGDARDVLLLTILPVEDGTNPYNAENENYNQVFGFQYRFIITDEEDIPSDTGKLKKFNIIDFDYQILKEKNLFFSTARLSNKTDIGQISNSDRRAFTGTILKNIIQQGLGDSSTILTTISAGQEITPNFETGSSQIFYSSPANSTALEDLMYVYDLHCSDCDGKDFAWLEKDHYTGEYSLESASNTFKKAYNKQEDSGGFYFIENLTITGGTDGGNIVENDLKKPLKAIEFGETGDIMQVKFFNTPGGDYQKYIRSTLVHSYDFGAKNFQIDSSLGNIENVKQDFTDLYVAPMKGKNNKPFPNLIINNTQRDNFNFENVFTVYSQDNSAIKRSVGRNRLLKNAIRLNLGVEITVQGGLYRQSKQFFSVSRKGDYIDNDFDNKFLGIYLVLSVQHTFINDNEYLNRLLAVKTYSFDNLNINENSI